jgi:hypothetical protein
MPNRTTAIGDIPGCSLALDSLRGRDGDRRAGSRSAAHGPWLKPPSAARPATGP